MKTGKEALTILNCELRRAVAADVSRLKLLPRRNNERTDVRCYEPRHEKRSKNPFPAQTPHFIWVLNDFPGANAVFSARTLFSRRELRFFGANVVFQRRTAISSGEQRFPAENSDFQRRTAISSGEQRFPAENSDFQQRAAFS